MYILACEALKKLCELPTVDEAGNEGDADTATSLVALAAQFALEVSSLTVDNLENSDYVSRDLQCFEKMSLISNI